jgi:hypothetical protein
VNELLEILVQAGGWMGVRLDRRWAIEVLYVSVVAIPRDANLKRVPQPGDELIGPWVKLK